MKQWLHAGWVALLGAMLAVGLILPVTAFADSIANKIVEGSSEPIKLTFANTPVDEQQMIDALRGSLFNLSSMPLVLEKAISNFVEKRAYAIGSPMFSRDTFHSQIGRAHV